MAQRRGERPPAVHGPALVGEHRRGVDDGIWLRRDQVRSHPACRTHDFRYGGNAEQFGKAEHIAHAMLLPVDDIGSAQRQTLHRRRQSIRFDGPGALPARDPGQQRRPVAALGGERNVVTPRQPAQQRKGFTCARTLRHGNDPGEIGIARQNSFRAGEHQRLDGSGRERALDAANERRRQQHVAEPAQRHHQHAGIARQGKRRHGFAPGDAAGGNWASRNTVPPTMPTPNT